MPTSITKSQVDALADGFISNALSTEGKEALQPRNTLSVLYQLAGGLVDMAQKNLARSGKVATGSLSESIKVLNPEVVGKTIKIDIELLSYYKFIDAGVKGTKSGSSSKGYSYKDKMPPVNIIRKWLIKEGLAGEVDRKYKKLKLDTKVASRRDTFRKSITETSNSVAFAMARSIKMKGLKRTNFFSKAVASTERKAKQQLAAGFKIDIINAIPTKI